jgi:hypothetical protein
MGKLFRWQEAVLEWGQRYKLHWKQILQGQKLQEQHAVNWDVLEKQQHREVHPAASTHDPAVLQSAAHCDLAVCWSFFVHPSVFIVLFNASDRDREYTCRMLYG